VVLEAVSLVRGYRIIALVNSIPALDYHNYMT
jgi:hypothetical protein